MTVVPIYGMRERRQTLSASLAMSCLRTENALVSFVALKPADEPPHAAHRHPYDQMIIVTHGTLWLWIDDQDHELVAGQALVVPANAWHTGRALGRDIAEVIEVFAPVRADYLPFTEFQQERFADREGAAWFHPDDRR